MKKVEKAMMFVWRDNEGTREFFVVHRKRGDLVVPTGHLEAGETPAQAASREVEEELGVKPLHVVPLAYKSEVLIDNGNQHSTEYAFLIEIPNQFVEFLENNETGQWHTFDELTNLLSYDGQKDALPFVENLL